MTEIISSTIVAEYQGFNELTPGWTFTTDSFFARYVIPENDTSENPEWVVNPTTDIPHFPLSVDKSAVWSNTVGANIKFSFLGTQISLFAPTSDQQGTIAITIDNSMPSVVSPNNPEFRIPVVQSHIWSSPLLSNTTHDVVITMISGDFVLDYIKYVHRMVFGLFHARLIIRLLE